VITINHKRIALGGVEVKVKLVEVKVKKRIIVTKKKPSPTRFIIKVKIPDNKDD
jgi:hypothetical protein